MKTVRIKVTKRDIRLGSQMEPNRCPVTRALERAGFDDATVPSADHCIFVNDDGTPVSLPLPKKAQHFIDRFDVRKPVKPFTFTLRLA